MVAAVGVLGAAQSAMAGTATATFQVTATVNSACVVSATNVAFGTITPAATGTTSAAGTITSTCTKTTPYTLAISAGGSGSVAARTMAGGTSGNTDVFQKSQDAKQGFCLGYGQSCITSQKTAFIGASLPHGLGGLNLSYVDRATPIGQSRITSLQWNKQINKYINIFSSLSSTKSVSDGNAPTNNKVLYVGLSLNFDSHFYTNSSYTQDKNGGPSYQQSIYKGEDPMHPEYGYGSITMNKTNDSQTQNLYYGARLKNFSYQVNSYRDDKGIKTNFGVDGAIAYIPEENYVKFTKSMNGGLVFVNVENLTIPAEISHENRFAGMSDDKGRFLVSDAVALNNENVSININKLPKSITLEENKKQFYIPFSGAVRVDFKSKPLPYIVKIKGAPTGAIFEMNKEYYVIGDKGNVSVETEGDTQIPLDGGEVCNLHITKKQKEYMCESNKVKKEPVKDTSEVKKEEPKKDEVKTEKTSPKEEVKKVE